MTRAKKSTSKSSKLVKTVVALPGKVVKSALKLKPQKVVKETLKPVQDVLSWILPVGTIIGGTSPVKRVTRNTSRLVKDTIEMPMKIVRSLTKKNPLSKVMSSTGKSVGKISKSAVGLVTMKRK